MPRLIDADKVADFVCSVCGENCDDECRRVCLERQFTEKCAEKMPTVDAESVVRCKDCKHYTADGCDECELMIAKSIIASINDKRWYSDFYCAWGERRQ